MDHYLVDFENVRTDGIKDLHGVSEGDAIVLFYSESCKNITIDLMESITRLRLSFGSFKVATGTKNALDFQLSSYLGCLIGKYGGSSRYHIVSNDKGFDCLCAFWGAEGISVDRITLQDNSENAAEKTETKKEEKNVPKKAEKPAPKKAEKNAVKKTENKQKKQKGKVPDENTATLAEISKYLSKDDSPEQVLKIFNQYKTKQAISNGITKLLKDSKKASSIYKKLKPLLKEKNKTS